MVGEHDTDRLGNYSLRIFHRPGHTSGCISIIDTAFLPVARCIDSAQSGIIGDYIDSLTRVRYFGPRTLYSGHDRISATPMEDIDHAIANAQKILASTMDGGPEVFYQKSDEY